eukprot:jgi/Botrbrau1/1748/Bobra.0217s0006.1
MRANALSNQIESGTESQEVRAKIEEVAKRVAPGNSKRVAAELVALHGKHGSKYGELFVLPLMEQLKAAHESSAEVMGISQREERAFHGAVMQVLRKCLEAKESIMAKAIDEGIVDVLLEHVGGPFCQDCAAVCCLRAIAARPSGNAALWENTMFPCEAALVQDESQQDWGLPLQFAQARRGTARLLVNILDPSKENAARGMSDSDCIQRARQLLKDSEAAAEQYTLSMQEAPAAPAQEYTQSEQDAPASLAERYSQSKQDAPAGPAAEDLMQDAARHLDSTDSEPDTVPGPFLDGSKGSKAAEAQRGAEAGQEEAGLSAMAGNGRAQQEDGLPTMPSNGRARRKPTCWQCGVRRRPDGTRLKVCCGCKRAYYCGEGCQKRHWPLHKPECHARPSPDAL